MSLFHKSQPVEEEENQELLVSLVLIQRDSARLSRRLAHVNMTMQSLQDIIDQTNAQVAVVSTEVNNLISRIQSIGTGGLTAAEVATLQTNLDGLRANVQAIAPEPPVV